MGIPPAVAFIGRYGTGGGEVVQSFSLRRLDHSPAARARIEVYTAFFLKGFLNLGASDIPGTSLSQKLI